MSIKLKSTFELVHQCDTSIIILDEDKALSVTNDAESVVLWLDKNLDGGIKGRKVYYLDTNSRFDELVIAGGKFCGFRSCSPSQQSWLAKVVLYS